ncbi:fimbrillin family protein [Hoylesella enoeca]|uniref:fimbrillin family protein n=1 Tax=Hoylesella enoeca TaxID=76123 RepID=UPI001F292276|nr:fimbrillin family protein [Hoylesella enoeca]
MYDKLYWNWDSNHFGRFYAVFPEVKTAYSKIKLSPNTHGGNPYVEFEADPDVANQKDLMTACSGVVEYQTRGVAPNTSLAFRHALTAVHFTVGQNLWAGQITKIKISGAISKGTYTLNSDPTQPGTWAPGSTTGTFTLDGININTATNPGS